MAERNQSFDALVLRTRDSPSGDRIVSLLCAEYGLVDAFVFGGPKSHLRSASSPFIFGRAFIYADPVRNYRKLVDMSPIQGFPGLRDSYERLMAATTISEMILKTSGCGGDFPEILGLALGCLMTLEGADSEGCETVLCAFLWRTLDLMGLKPDAASCANCGRSLDPEASGGLSYSRKALGFVCPACPEWEPSIDAAEARMLGILESAREGEMPRGGVKPGGGLSILIRSLAQDAAEGPVSSLAASWAIQPPYRAPPYQAPADRAR
ncbi:MAG TPA: DNA repair protein RecO [Rectinemataceae bacterium]